MSDPYHGYGGVPLHPGYQEPCGVCKGRGVMLVENGHGSSVDEVPCPYCRGANNLEWIWERRTARWAHWAKVRNVLIGSTAFLVLFNGALPWNPGDIGNGANYLFLVHALLWIAVLAGWFVWFLKKGPTHKQLDSQGPPQPGKPQPQWQQKPKTRHAPGFSDGKEAAGVAALLIGLAVKGEHDARQRRVQNTLDDINRKLGS